MYNDDSSPSWSVFLAFMGGFFLLKLIWSLVSIVLSVFLFKIPSLFKNRSRSSDTTTACDYTSDSDPNTSDRTSGISVSGHETASDYTSDSDTSNRSSGISVPGYETASDYTSDSDTSNRSSGISVSGYETASDSEMTPVNDTVTSNPSSTSSDVFVGGFDYDVFLSFRGSDTRKKFTDHLYNSLIGAGIRVFRDNEELRVGDEIGDNLLEAISRSRIFIPIFSEDYASSKWCLKEVAHAVKCRNGKKLSILPVFYDVTPDDVKHQSGTYYKKAFEEHSSGPNKKKVKEWRDSLKEIGHLKGWELANIANGHEGVLVKEIVSAVRRELAVPDLILKEPIVGIEDSVEEVMDLLNVGASDVRIIGIHGIGGIGKTTLAKAIHNQILHQFERTSFLVDVRETSSQHKGLQKLQTRLVSDILQAKQEEFFRVDDGIKELSKRCGGKKVLIVLDDIDKRDQLDSLVGDGGWFARGSRIILTTRNRDLLEASQVAGTFEVPEMQSTHARALFCKYAFGSDSPPPGFEDLTDKIISTTGHLPLALEIIGSLPYGKDKEQWVATHKRLQDIPHENVQKKLKISYEALDNRQKHIFLDIACFFIGTDWRIAFHMWEHRRFYPGDTIRVLRAMSLIKINQCEELWMHDQLRDLGRTIVLDENYNDPGRIRRLWSSEEAMEVLNLQKGMETIEAIHLGYGTQSEDYCFTSEQFMKLSNLRFLRLNKANFAGNFDKLLPELNWLHWHNCPATLNATNFRWKRLLILDLSESKVTCDWNGWSSMQTAAGLKVLILRSCCELAETPDFSNLLALERLSLDYCKSLECIGKSIGELKKLKFLSLKYCSRLKALPQELSFLEALTELCIDGTCVKEIPSLAHLQKLEMLSAKECKSLTEIPRSIRHLTSLVKLLLDSTGVLELPDSIGKLVNLERLSLDRCKSLRKVPDSIGRLQLLKELRLSETSIKALPDSIERLKNLEVLNLNESKLVYLPDALRMLEKLKVINIDSCRALSVGILPDLERLHHLRDLILVNTNITMLPESIGKLFHLQTLDLTKCDKLETLPELPCSLRSLSVTCKPLHAIPDISNLVNLEQLQLIKCDNLGEIPKEICKLSKLKKLRITQTNMRELPEEIGMLSRLKELAIVNCKQLQSIPKLPTKLYKLEVKGYSAQKFPDLSNSTKLSEFELVHCLKLESIQGLGCLKFLTVLRVSECGELAELDGLEELESLRDLHISQCDSLEKLPDLSKLRQLRYWVMERCRSLQSLPNLSGLKLLRTLNFSGCEKLEMLEGVDELESLQTLDISECKEIENLTLSKLWKLTFLNVRGCEKLTEIRVPEESEVRVEIYIHGCTSLQNIPDLHTWSIFHGSTRFTTIQSDNCIWKL